MRPTSQTTMCNQRFWVILASFSRTKWVDLSWPSSATRFQTVKYWLPSFLENISLWLQRNVFSYLLTYILTFLLVLLLAVAYLDKSNFYWNVWMFDGYAVVSLMDCTHCLWHKNIGFSCLQRGWSDFSCLESPSKLRILIKPLRPCR